MRYEVKIDDDDPTQWMIWDTVESRAFARFATEKEASDIVNRFYAAQLAAETSGG